MFGPRTVSLRNYYLDEIMLSYGIDVIPYNYLFSILFGDEAESRTPNGYNFLRVDMVTALLYSETN
jgi:hypothetical protein